MRAFRVQSKGFLRVDNALLVKAIGFAGGRDSFRGEKLSPSLEVLIWAMGESFPPLKLLFKDGSLQEFP